MNAGHVAVVLAAGGSRRLGRPKQLLLRDGETLIRRTVRLLATTSPRRLLVVVGARRDAMRRALDGIDCECIDNPDWQRGLASSLHAAAAALAGDAAPVLVAACDQPALAGAHLRALLAGAAASASACAATLHAGRPGVPAVVPGRWFADTASLDGDSGFGRRLRALPRQDCFLLDEPELSFDIDEESDVRVAVAKGWLDAPG